MSVKSISANIYNAIVNDEIVHCQCAKSALTFNLYSSVSNIGRTITIKKMESSTNNITIYPASGETIDGASSITITNLNEYRTLKAVNGGWSVIDTGNKNQFGDVEGGNYSEFESDGTLVFNGNATTYDDLPPNPIIRSRQPAANNPTLATLKGAIQQYTFAVNDYVSDNFELLHSWKPGTNLNVHIHWATNGSEGTDKAVKWEFTYTISNAHATAPFTDAFGDTVAISSETVIPANTPDRAHIISSLGTIDGTNLRIGSVVAYNIKRIASSGSAPTSNPFGLQVAAHIEQDTTGSRSLYTK